MIIAMAGHPFTVAHISDLHLDPDQPDQRDRFQEIRRTVRELHPDIIVSTGDVSADGHLRPGLFEKVKAQLDTLGKPVHVVPGNHDVGEPDGPDQVQSSYLENWRKTYGNDRFVIQEDGWTLIGINSQIVGSGLAVEAEQWRWFDEQLDQAEHGGRHVGVFLHQPVYLFEPHERFHDKSDYWPIRPHARQQMMQRLDRPQVKLVASGHVHWYHVAHDRQFTSVWCPSTSFVVDDAKFPPGGDVIGVLLYRFDGAHCEHRLVEMNLSKNTYGFQRPVVDLPGRGAIKISHVALDFTGTLSRDGELLPVVTERIARLARQVRVSVFTADTFGAARQALAGLPVNLHVISNGQEKARLVRQLGAEEVVAIGNGRNDLLMVQQAAIGIAVIGPEGAAAELLTAADVVVNHIEDALDLVLNPLRLKATLRD